jgi:hypothetical protein
MFSLALVAVAGGVASYMATNDQRAIESAQVQKSRDASQQANVTNLSAIGSLMRFPSDIPAAQQVASNPAFVPSVYPDPYIYGGNPGSVKLIAIKNPGAAARWSANGQGEIAVEGFNSGKLNDAAMDQVFQNGGELQYTANNQKGDSRIRMTQVVETAADARITKVRVASLASVADSQNANYQDILEADISVPKPPAPQVSYSPFSNIKTPLSYGQAVTVRLQGYGLMTSVQLTSTGSNPVTVCTPAIPAAAYSIRNTLSGGFSLGSCGFAFNGASLKPTSDPAKGYFEVTITATGPGGTSTVVEKVYAWNPPSCTFPYPTNYTTTQDSGTTIKMTTSAGPLSTAPQMQMPVNTGRSVNGWTQVGNWVGTSGGPNTWTSYFGAGYEHGQAYIEGRVTGPGIQPGTWKSCDNVASVNIDQRVCYEHTQGQWYYLGQCYRLPDGRYMKWYAQGPQYQRCRGNFFNNAWCWWGYGYRDGGCFAPETEITMADGSARRIDEIRNGDLVYNPLTGSSSKVKGLIRGPEKEPMIEVGYGGKVVRVTTKHPMLTRSGIKTATELQYGDYLLGADRKFHRINELKRLPVDPNQQVYNFVMDDQDDSPAHHVVLADGILTGDLQLQKQLEKGPVSMSKVAIDSN